MSDKREMVEKKEREMKRDMDLVRAILMEVERHPSGFAPREIKIDGYTPEQIKFHVYIMAQADFVEAAEITHYQSPGSEAIVRSLTWQGYEFLDNAREPTRWEQAKALAVKARGVSAQILLILLTDLVRMEAGIVSKKILDDLTK